jgi:hypothetical protein
MKQPSNRKDIDQLPGGTQRLYSDAYSLFIQDKQTGAA